MLKLGEKSIKSLYFGGKSYAKAYLGEKLVFNKIKKPYYCEVEYLESTGTQYVDTGYIPTENTSFDLFGVDMDYHASTTRFGSRIDSLTENYCFTVINGDNFRMSYGTSTKTVDIQYIFTEQKLAKKISWNATDKTCTMTFNDDSTEQSSAFTTTSLTSAAKSIYMFAFNNNGTPVYGLSKQTGLKIYENEMLVRDYIPVLDNNKKPCLYDKVSGKLFYNQGSGDFLYGREIHEVEYLESDGNQYIDTGIIGNSDTKAELALIITKQATGNVGVFGSRGNSANSNLLAIGYGTSLLASDFNNSSYSSYRASVSYELDTKYICYTSKEKRFIKDENGVVLAENTTLCNDKMSTSNLLLFAETGVSLRQQGKMFYAKIWNDNILVRDYIPAIDEKDKGFMFDRVSHTIFDNQGSGEFIKGK